ncbi:MAG TPA: TetR/AcrR family transcriptional regulator C-terminal domain-containing protein [Streptosporangiaceae bacterium]
MSLYSHVDSKDALLDGIVEIMSAEAEMPPAGGMDWRDALRSLARSLREVIRRHPAAAPLLVSRPVMPTCRLEVIDAYLQVLRHAGFPEDRALDVLRTVYVYAQGYAWPRSASATAPAARTPAGRTASWPGCGGSPRWSPATPPTACSAWPWISAAAAKWTSSSASAST